MLRTLKVILLQSKNAFIEGTYSIKQLLGQMTLHSNNM